MALDNERWTNMNTIPRMALSNYGRVKDLKTGQIFEPAMVREVGVSVETESHGSQFEYRFRFAQETSVFVDKDDLIGDGY